MIDGTITDAEWGGIPTWSVTIDSHSADGIQNGQVGDVTDLPVDNDDLSMPAIRVGYDTNYLYVAVHVRDSVISTDDAAADSANGNTWFDDSVEVFVDGINANDARYSPGQLGGQHVITANNAYRDPDTANPSYGETNAWFAKTAVSGNGYDAEFRISMASLGNPKEGDIVGFTVGVNDDDGLGVGLRQHQILWAGKTHQPVTYGNLVLGGKTYSAPKISAAPIVDGVINPAEYVGAIEIKVDGTTGVYDGGDDDWPAGDHAYSAWVVHTADAVYVAVNVTDDKIVSDSAVTGSEDGNTWEDDSVEIFFDADSDHEPGRGGKDFEGQYVFTANGARRDNEARNPTFGSTAADHWFAATTKTAGGYQVEFKVMKAALLNVADGATMGFNIAINDDDGGDAGRVQPKTQLGWSGRVHRELTYGQLTLATGTAPSKITIGSLQAKSSQMELTFTSSKPSATHVVEQSSSLAPAKWTSVASVTFANGAAGSSVASFPKPTDGAAFYRVRF